MKKEYIKPEMAEILVQTCGVLAASEPESVNGEISGEKIENGHVDSSGFFDDGSDNSDW